MIEPKDVKAPDIERAIRWGMCLRCGEKLGKFRANAITPGQYLARQAPMPQMDTKCARFIAQQAGRVMVVFITREPSQLFGSEHAASFRLPEACAIEWWNGERPAFREEAIMATKRDLPMLFEMCHESVEKFSELGTLVWQLSATLPRNIGPNVSSCADCRKSTADVGVMGCTKEGCPLFGEEPIT